MEVDAAVERVHAAPVHLAVETVADAVVVAHIEVGVNVAAAVVDNFDKLVGNLLAESDRKSTERWTRAAVEGQLMVANKR